MTKVQLTKRFFVETIKEGSILGFLSGGKAYDTLTKSFTKEIEVPNWINVTIPTCVGQKAIG